MARKKRSDRTPERKGRLVYVIMGHGARLLGAAAYLAFIGGVFALIYWRLGDLNARYAGKATDAVKSLESSEDSTLFFNLVRAKLISARDSDSGLDMAPPDHVLIRKAVGGKNDEDEGISEGEQETLLKSLYDSAAGTIVRSEVSRWNGTRRIAAVRDDRKIGDGDENRVLWRAASEGGIPKPLGTLVPESFGFVNRDQIPIGMSEWITVAGPRENERIVFSTRTSGISGNITVQVIGRPIKVPPGARVDRRTFDFFAQRGELKWACRTVAEAAVVTIPVRGDGPLEITVEPAANCSPSVFGLAISMTGEDLAGKPRQKPRKKGTRPDAKDPGTITAGTVEWSYNWRSVPRFSPGAPGAGDKLFVIKTADGVPLTDPQGKGAPTKAAADLGLISVVGYSRADSMSLIGLLRSSKLPVGTTEVSLTIDSRVQKIVQDTVAYHVTRVVDKIDRPRLYFHERRASVTVLDIETGAIVAIGGWPLVPLGARSWDYISYQISNPNKDPTQVASWQLISGDNTPGSTWKTLTALASAMEASDAAARPDPAIAQMLLGSWDAGQFQQRLGIPASAPTVTIPGSTRSISNFGRTGMTTQGVLQTAACSDTGQPVAANMINVSLAIKASYNAFFARLAMLLDEKHVADWIRSLPKNRAGRVADDIRELPPTRFMERLKQIGIDWEKPLDLGANLGPKQPLHRVKLSNTFDKLYARPPLTAITRNVDLRRDNPAEAYRPEFLHRIALNGIGQSWSVTTLHVALGAATIAKGSKVHPYLISRWGRDRLDPPADNNAPLNIRQDLLQAIRAGMKAVTEAPGATATGVYATMPLFVHSEEMSKHKNDDLAKRVAAVRQPNAKAGVKPIWCRTYGKTGTADPPGGAKGGYNSGWFTSWKEPLQPGGRRFAIACMVTHLDYRHGGPKFGGAVCGALVRDIMFSLETMERPDLKANPGEDEPKEPPPDAPEGTEEESDRN